MAPAKRTWTNGKEDKKMRKNMIFSGAMSWMTALLLCTACSSDDVTTDKAAAAVPEGKVIHYTATVGEGDETRATLNGGKKYEYQVGDKLVITGTDISGELTLTGDPGTTATFEGDLNYTGDGTPADNLELKAVLVSTNNAMTTLTYDAAEYPTGAIASTLVDAVQKYSHFTATSTYAAKDFKVSQQTAFLNFTVMFTDGTTANTDFDIVIKNGGSTVRTGRVKTAEVDSKVVAQFVAAMPKGTTMSSATVQLGTKSAIAFGGTTKLVANKIYNIKKTIEAAYITGNVGQVICSDGTVCNYADKGSKTVVAVIVYKGSDTGNSTYNHGLALALFDANGGNATTNGTACQWKTSTGSTDNSYQTTSSSSFASEDGSIYRSRRNTSTWPAFQKCISYSGGTAPTSSTGWFLPSAYQWNKMVSGVGSYSTLRNYFSSRGGRNMQSDYYWSCTVYSKNLAWNLTFNNGSWSGNIKTSSHYVRACFAF